MKARTTLRASEASTRCPKAVLTADSTTVTADSVAAVLVTAPPHAPWCHEGVVRHGLRRILCLAGQRWEIADQTAAGLIKAARARGGIPAPIGYDHGDLGLEPRGRACAQCGANLPDHRHGNRLYCSSKCRVAHYHAHPHAVSKQIRKVCAICGGPMAATTARQLYCGPDCRGVAERQLKREHSLLLADCRAPTFGQCAICGKTFEKGPRQGRQRYCSPAHAKLAANAQWHAYRARVRERLTDRP